MPLVNLGTAMAYLDLDTSGFNNGISSALSNLNVFTQQTASVADKVTAVGTAFTGVGQTLTTNVTLPLMGVATAGVKIASDFEKSMSGVRAITGAVGEDFEALEQTAIELGATTAFSANEVANAMTEMAKAGWNTQQIIEGMAGVLDATAASGENLGTVATIVADSITGFGLAAKDSGRVANLLTQAANSGTIDIYDLGEAFKYIAPVANSASYSIEDVTTAVAALSTAGIKGSQSGTSLRGMLTRLIHPTGKSELTLRKLGIAAANADGTLKPLNQLLAEMRVAFSDLTEAEQAEYAAIIAGQNAMSGMLTLLNMSQEEYDAIAEAMQNASGVADETASVMQDNLQSSIEQLGGAMESLAITLGKHVIPYVRDFVIWLTSLVEKFVSIDEQAQKTILVIAAIASAIGPVLLLIGGLITHVGSLMSAITTLQTIAAAGSGTFLGMVAPIATAVAGITALVATLVYLYNTSETFREGIQELTSKFALLGKELRSRIEPYIQKLSKSFDSLQRSFQPILEAFGQAFLEVLNLILELLFNIAPAIEPLLDMVIQAVNLLSGLADLLVAAFTGNEQLMIDASHRIVENIKSMFNSGVTFIGSLFSGLVETVRGLFDSLFGEGSFDRLFGPAVNSINTVLNTLQEKFNSVYSNLVEHLNILSSQLAALFAPLVAWWEENGQQVFNHAEATVTKILQLLQPLIDFFVNTFEGTLEGVSIALDSLFLLVEGLIALITGDFDRASECFEAFGENMYDLEQLHAQMVENLKEAWNSFWEEFGYQLYDFKESWNTFWEDFGYELYNFGQSWNSYWESWGASLYTYQQEQLEAWNTFWEDVGYSLYDTVQGWKEELKAFFTETIPNLLAEAKQSIADWWDGLGSSNLFGVNVDGSHANGLAYVPFDGYIAELHKGERVLTAEENTQYNQGGGTSPVYNQYIIADTRLDRYEIQKDTEDLLIWGGVKV